MLTDMVQEPLHLARLIFIIDNLEALAGGVPTADAVTTEDVDQLTELVDHLNDYRPGGRIED